MSTLLTIGGITKKSLFVLKNTCTALPLVTSDYSSEFAVSGAKIGYTINIRKPPRYEVNVGQQAVLQSTTEQFTTLALSRQINISLPFSMADRTLSLDNYTERVIAPKMAALANFVDFDVLQLGEKVANSVGTPGVTPTTLLTYSQAGALLSNLGTPKQGRSVVMTPDMQASITGAQNTLALYNPSGAISEQYRTGQIMEFSGLKFYEDQNLAAHTMGTVTPSGAAILANSATAQIGNSVITDGWTSGNLNPGDTFTFGTLGAANAVYEANPQNRTSTGRLRQFVVAAPVTAAAGAATIVFSPAIVPSGPFQNVTQGVVDNAPLTFVQTSGATNRYGLAFGKSAFGIGFADIELPPKGVVESFRAQDEDTGLSMATVTAYDIMGGQTISRTDLIYGTCQLYEDTACRIWQL